MAINYKDKIRKLLALADSPVEAEARAALLKARQLMAEHKLTEKDVVPSDTAVIRGVTGITFNGRRDYWVLRLSEIIAPNYCCQPFFRRTYGKQTSEVGFVGFADDFEICSNVYKYAVDCIQSWISAATQGKKLTAAQKKTIGYSFADGFCKGLLEAFEEQKEQNREEWALVPVVPKEVTDEMSQMEAHTFTAKKVERSEAAFSEGYTQGREFKMNDRLQAENGTPA